MNYIINMLAKPQTINTSQMAGNSVADVMEFYLKNSAISLISAKRNNPLYICILFSNFEIPAKFKLLFESNGIQIRHLEFGQHAISNKYNWSIVNYRYDVMKQLSLELESDDKVVTLDTDTICLAPLNDLFEELDEKLLLFDVQHRLGHSDRKNIIDNYQKIYGKRKCITHYGGEFLGANGSILKELYQACCEVLNLTENREDLANWNDEHITSIAVDNQMRSMTGNANPYIYRYWTGRFYLTSTNYINNPISIWHLPSEKKDGMIRIFQYFEKQNKLPDSGKMAKMLGFPRSHRPFYMIWAAKKAFHKIMEAGNRKK